VTAETWLVVTMLRTGAAHLAAGPAQPLGGAAWGVLPAISDVASRCWGRAAAHVLLAVADALQASPLRPGP
jgi:hypothetical protein